MLLIGRVGPVVRPAAFESVRAGKALDGMAGFVKSLPPRADALDQHCRARSWRVRLRADASSEPSSRRMWDVGCRT